LKRALCIVTLITAVVSAAGQTPVPSSTAGPPELFDTIARQDTKIFDVYNAHDREALMAIFTDDLEFYQDNDGVKNYQECSEDFRKMFMNTPDIRRDLVKGTLKIYPIKNYGAIEIGAHRFCHKEAGQDECGVFEFVMLWKQTADTWKISRVVSYGH
jgi:ketosteroid isomerase-like protein